MINRSFTRRLFILAVLKIILFLTIIIRLFYLQIKENLYFNTLSIRNKTSHVPIIPKRGIIYDCFHKPLVSNQLVWQLMFIKSTLDQPIDDFIKALTKFIKLDQDEQKQIVKSYKNASTSNAILIKNSVTTQEIATIETYHSLFSNVFVSASYNRVYLYSEPIAHIIGYISKSDIKNIPNWYTGKQGLELALDTILRGEVGYTTYEVNAKGKIIKKIEFTDSAPGQNITITIDKELQNFIYSLLRSVAASAIVIETSTGNILACTCTPSFNPNQLAYGISNKEWLKIVNNPKKPLNNRALSGLYPPASTLKPFMALFALQNNIISPSTIINCPGKIQIGNRNFYCWKHSGHGKLNVTQAVIHSCDIFFYTVGIQLEREDFINIGETLQINKNLLPLLPACVKGNLPLHKPVPPLGELAISAIGQGEWLVTPLHLANMATMLANKGQIKELKLLKSMDYNNKIIYGKTNKIIGSLPYDIKHINLVTNALDKIINNAATLWPMSGKTGTAQVVTITQEQRDKGLTQSRIKKYKEHAVFMGYFPTNNPQYAVSVVIEHAGFGTTHAVPIAQQIANFIFNKQDEYSKARLQLQKILTTNNP